MSNFRQIDPRRISPGDIERLFVEVLLLAREMGMLAMGTVGLDGTKIHANASRHSALSWGHACKIEAQLKAEVAELMAKAEAADRSDLPDGLSIPDELARRKERLAKLAEVRAKIEARARERFEREQAEPAAKLAAREAKARQTGKKPGGPSAPLRAGKPPESPPFEPRPTDQINLTDEQPRIMPAMSEAEGPVAGGGFDQCYNAQAAVATGSSSRWGAGSRPCPKRWARRRPCWPTAAISVPPMSRLARRRASSR